jgi:hypothetical protein
MTDDIKRQDIDDYNRRVKNKNSYKNRVFNGKRTTIDEYSGDKLFFSDKGRTALNEQNRHFTTETTANVDHVVPLNQIKNKYGGKVSKKQLKRISNSDTNLAITSEARNKAKSNMSNREYIFEQLKKGSPEDMVTTYNMLQKQIASSTSISVDVTVTHISEKAGATLSIDKNKLNEAVSKAGEVTNSAVYSGTSAALISLAVSGINNLALIAAGEKTPEKAVKDIAQDTSASFVSAAGLDLTQRAVLEIAKKGGNKELIKALGKGLPIAEISATVMIGNSIIRYINDDISAEECVTEILMNGIGTWAFSLGMAAGGPAGAVIASLVVAQISKIVLEYRQINRLNAEKERQINSLVSEALIEMARQRAKLQQMITAEYQQWDEAVELGFKQIFISSLDNNVNGISEGLNTILDIFKQEVKFTSLKEFNDFFKDEEAVFTL